MRKESAIIRKCSAQRTGEPFHYASIQHILSNVMNAGILRSGKRSQRCFLSCRLFLWNNLIVWQRLVSSVP